MSQLPGDKLDGASLPPGEQQQLSWLSVCNLLREIFPDFTDRFKGSGEQKALAAIRQLERELRIALNDVAQLKQGYANLQRESAVPELTERDSALEEAAKACDAYHDEHWKAYKTGHGPSRGNDYVQGEADAAGDLAERIRALQKAAPQVPDSARIGDSLESAAPYLGPSDSTPAAAALSAAAPESRTINAADQAGACPGVGSTPTSAAPITLPGAANRLDQVYRLRNKAHFCRQEGYPYVASLLDEAADRIDQLKHELAEANKRAEELAVELNGVRPYQKYGETAGQCVERNWTDSQNALGLFAKERIRSENAERELAEAIKDRDAHAEDSRQKDARIERLVAASRSARPPLQRYDMNIYEGQDAVVPEQSEHGSWVRYEDVAAATRSTIPAQEALEIVLNEIAEVVGIDTPYRELPDAVRALAARSTTGKSTVEIVERTGTFIDGHDDGLERGATICEGIAKRLGSKPNCQDQVDALTVAADALRKLKSPLSTASARQERK